MPGNDVGDLKSARVDISFVPEEIAHGDRPRARDATAYYRRKCPGKG